MTPAEGLRAAMIAAGWDGVSERPTIAILPDGTIVKLVRAANSLGGLAWWDDDGDDLWWNDSPDQMGDCIPLFRMDYS